MEETNKPKAQAIDKNQHIQSGFLKRIRDERTPVTVFLMNGVKLQGIISDFDNYTMLLRRDGINQLLFKQAISTIMPAVSIEVDAS
ncbi:RNA-binding protein Hfq [Alphaproteobacteria bacterium]|nr:RNA-binding protein Hfq [Alphaproteobacteria bacterium]